MISSTFRKDMQTKPSGKLSRKNYEASVGILAVESFQLALVRSLVIVENMVD